MRRSNSSVHDIVWENSTVFDLPLLDAFDRCRRLKGNGNKIFYRLILKSLQNNI